MMRRVVVALLVLAAIVSACGGEEDNDEPSGGLLFETFVRNCVADGGAESECRCLWDVFDRQGKTALIVRFDAGPPSPRSDRSRAEKEYLRIARRAAAFCSNRDSPDSTTNEAPV